MPYSEEEAPAMEVALNHQTKAAICILPLSSRPRSHSLIYYTFGAVCRNLANFNKAQRWRAWPKVWAPCNCGTTRH